MGINWYPGHMVKAKKEIRENIGLVDIIIILLDARAPFSCRNREIEEMAKDKKVIMILNKADLVSREKISYYQQQLTEEGHVAIRMDSLNCRGRKEVVNAIHWAYKEKAEGMLKRGRRVRPVRVMVTGVPNVGKSTFLNCLVGKKMARTGSKPGVTRGKQWVRVRNDIELMDTPGLMWPKIAGEEQGLKLALLNVVGEKAYSENSIALYLIRVLKQKAPGILADKYKIKDLSRDENQLLEDITINRGYLLKGGEIDQAKTCQLLLRDFRQGELGNWGLD